jgi:hypothetical protein
MLSRRQFWALALTAPEAARAFSADEECEGTMASAVNKMASAVKKSRTIRRRFMPIPSAGSRLVCNSSRYAAAPGVRAGSIADELAP